VKISLDFGKPKDYTSYMDNLNNTVTEAEIDALLGETHKTVYHANHLIADKNIDPKSPNFGKKGESYYLKNGNQWYIRYKGNEDFTRVQWWQLDSNVAEGSYGQARYVGLNSSIYGKIGELSYTNRKWVFNFDGEKYNLNSPASVEVL
jgi:hypothetical protein